MKEKVMDGQKEVLRVREIAARFICEDVERGLEDLDRIVNEWHRLAAKKSKLPNRIFITLSAAIVFFLLMFFACFENRAVIGVLHLLIIGLVPIWVLSVLYLRKSQYGDFNPSFPQKICHLDPNDPAVANLNCFFKIAQSEIGPRAFYKTRGGIRREVKRQYFFGNMRLAMLAESPSIKATMWAPWGLWFDRELFMEVDVEALIAQTKAKPEPKKRGPDTTYDFTDAIMSLIEHPEIRKLDPKWGSQTPIAGLLKEWFQENNRPVPGKTTLSEYASDVQAAIKKNRAKKS